MLPARRTAVRALALPLLLVTAIVLQTQAADAGYGGPFRRHGRTALSAALKASQGKPRPVVSPSPTPSASASPSAAPAPSPTSTPVTVTDSTTGQAFTIGVTHTRFTADSWNDPAAVSRAKAVLGGSVTLQNQHLMGFGADNPEPSDGVYDFGVLDERMDLIRSSGGTPVITLCCSPDWMKGGTPGSTDWSTLEVAPLPSHYADYAKLAETVARRYPWVKRYQVWNELKGFWNGSLNRWDYEGYTSLYNQVYDRLKAVDPTIQVGGPYVVMDTWSKASVMSNPSSLAGPWGVVDQRSLDVLTYWLSHAHGADFVVVDAALKTRDAGMTTDAVTAVGKFTAVASWLRARTTLPIWFGEYYVDHGSTTLTDASHAALHALAVLRMVQGGANAALQWSPQYDAGDPYPALWTSTATSTGGQRLPLADVDASLRQVLSGTPAASPLTDVAPGVVTYRSSTGLLAVNATDVAVVIGTTTVPANGVVVLPV